MLRPNKAAAFSYSAAYKMHDIQDCSVISWEANIEIKNMWVFKKNFQKKNPKLQLYEVPALGRPVALGELYDARTDQIGPGFLQANMADDFVVTKNGRTSFQTFQKDEMSSITSSWGISADLQLGVLSQAVQCGGSVRYLNDRGRFSHTFSSALKVTI